MRLYSELMPHALRAWPVLLALCFLPTASSQQSGTLAEARRLDKEVETLANSGHVAEALSVAERALAIREKLLGPNNPGMAAPLTVVADLYRNQARYADAERLYRRVLAIVGKAAGPDAGDVGKALANIAGVRKDQADYTGAATLYLRALRILEKQFGPESEETGSVLNDLALLYALKGKYDDAEPLYLRSLKISEKIYGPEHPETATTLDNLAALYLRQGAFAKAEPLSRRALSIREKALGPEHPDTGTSLNTLAYIFSSQGDYKQAEPLLRRALAINEKTAGPMNPDTAESLQNLAWVYVEMEEYGKAEPLYQRALAIREKALGPDHPDTAWTLENLADLYADLKQFPKAEPLYLRALAIRRKVLGPEHADTATSLNDLATLYVDSHQYAKAEPLFRQALEIYTRTASPEHPSTVTTLINLGTLCWAQDRPEEALPFLERAAEAEERQLDLNLAAGTEAQQLSYARTFMRTTSILVSFQNHHSAATSRRLAFEAVVRRKSRVLDTLAGESGILRRRLDAAGTRLFDELTATRLHYAGLVLNGPSESSPAAFQKELETIRGHEEEMVRMLNERSAEFRQERGPATAQAIEAALPDSAVLLEYVLFEPYDPKAARDAAFAAPHYGVFLAAKSGELTWTDLGPADKIDSLLRGWRVLLNNPADAASERADGMARSLYQALVQPVEQQVGASYDSLFVSSDAALHLLPWSALMMANGERLVDRFTLSMIDSGRDILRFGVRQPARQAPLVIANPAFGDDGAPDSPAWPALPGTHAEAELVRRLLGLASTRVLEGERATKAAVLGLHGPKVLHIATHGFFLAEQAEASDRSRRGIIVPTHPANTHGEETGDSTNPLLRSGLVFARPHGTTVGQSVLTAYEAAQLDLTGSELVVLSACETGVGETRTGEGVFGLKRAFTLAGAQSLLLSLWKVDDRVTGELMAAFYAALRSGRGRAAAVRDAQRLVAREHPSPYYWAAFVLSGNPRPISW